MKKLMFSAAVAAIAGSTLAIESANIVGFLNKASETPGAAEMAAPCFTSVDGSDITLDQISVTGYTKQENGGDGCDNGLAIAILGANGAVKKTGSMFTRYCWIDLTDDDLPAGWYDDNSDPLDGTSPLGESSEITFAPGTGFRVTEHSSFEGLSLTIAGAVKLSSTSVSSFVPGAATACGNPTPVEVKLSDITVTGYESQTDGGDGCDNGMAIAILDANGAVKKTGSMFTRYCWIDLTDDDLPAGWYDDNSDPLDGTSPLGVASEITFAPGAGFRVTEDSSVSGLVLNFPKPIAD